MNEEKKGTERARSPTVIVIVVLVIAMANVGLATRALYQRTVDLLTDNLRERLLTISITAAANIDPGDLAELRAESDWKKPAWSRVVTRLHRAKYSNADVVFMYIFRKKQDDPQSMEFVADADSIYPYANVGGNPDLYVDVNRDGIIEPDGPDKLQWPGQDYPEAVDIPEAFAAYSGPITSAELYTDAYGTVLTGYAPITDEHGNTVAVLATDIKADDFRKITTQTFRPFLLFMVSLILIVIALTIVIFVSWKRYAASFQVMNRQLRKLDRLKSEFLSFASHQIKSPLTAIKWQAQLLGSGDLGPLPEKAVRELRKIGTSVDDLVRLVNDFLDLRRLEEGRMEFNVGSVDLVALVRSTTEAVRPIADHKGIELTADLPDQPSVLRLDAERFTQVIRNLLDNAIKYTESGWVRIAVRQEPGHVSVTVSDSGRGMPPEIIPQLFEQFTREKDAAKQIEGTGLGLYIANQIVLAHDGTLTAESDGVGKGSTFTVRLPAAESAGNPAAGTHPAHDNRDKVPDA